MNQDDDYLRWLEQQQAVESPAEERNVAAAQQKYSQEKSQSNQPKNRFSKFTSRFSGKRSASPILAIAITLFGGGSIFTAILAPGATLLALADTLERDLHSSISALDKSSQQMWRSKLKQVTSGSCGAVKIRCKFETVNKEKFEKAIQRANATGEGKLKITYDDSKGFGDNRARIKQITYIDGAGKTEQIDGADRFTRLMKENPSFRETMFLVHNPRFSPFKGKPMMEFLAKNKTSYAKKLKGKTEKEVRASKAQAISGKSSISSVKLTPIQDKDGNPTGEYTDDKGNTYSADEAKGLLDQEERIKKSPSTHKLLRGMLAGALVTGAIDTACTVYNTSRAVSTGAKAIQAAELVRTSMVYTNEAHAIRAEMATPETVKVASDDIMYMEPRGKIADESKVGITPAGQPLPQIENPDGGKTGMDSVIYKMSSSQDYPKKLDAETQALLPGGGFTGTLDSVNVAIASVLGTDPAGISQACKIVQNPIVRGGALVIGIAAGVGSFGASTAASAAGSTAVAMSLPYLTARLADMAAGEITKDLKGKGLVSAIAIGSSLTYNGMARANGLMTMNPKDMANYQNRKRETLVAYDEIDKIKARENPFDMTNQFSFVGSLARSSLPIMSTIHSSGLGAIQALPQIASLALTSILPGVGAADARTTQVRPERYNLCKNDPDYKSLGTEVAIEPTCVMAFGLPDEAMNLDVDPAIDYMVAHDEIDPADESGAPRDNGREWNYAKYDQQCSKNQPGATEDIEAEPTNGSGCTDKKNFVQNYHYAKFTLLKNSSDYIDQELPGMSGGAQEDFADGSTSSTGQDGWAYPTDKAATTVSSPFGPRDGAQHNGIDITGPLGTPIYAARDGEVIAAGPASGFGNWIVIRHEVDGARFDTVYGHMSRAGVLVRRGQKVKAGDMIGRIGSEGQSSGPHLHFETWQGGRSDMDAPNGKAVDPQPYLEKAKTGNTTNEVRV